MRNASNLVIMTMTHDEQNSILEYVQWTLSMNDFHRYGKNLIQYNTGSEMMLRIIWLEFEGVVSN